MKKLLSLFVLTLTVQHSVLAQCNSGSYTVAPQKAIFPLSSTFKP
jgi:hypothetical protein